MPWRIRRTMRPPSALTARAAEIGGADLGDPQTPGLMSSKRIRRDHGAAAW